MRDDVVLGDVSEGLLRMLYLGRVDKDLLTGTYGIEVPKDTLTYRDYDKAILRQYGGAMIPSYKYSLFEQEKGITVHHHLFVIRYTVQNMELNQFSIPSDISHKSHTQDLMKRDRCDLVKDIACSDVELESEHDEFLEMESCIEYAQRIYWHNIETQLGCLDKEGNNVTSLPEAIAIHDLLNPLLGGKTRVLESGFMIEPQYGAAVDALLAEMQRMI